MSATLIGQWVTLQRVAGGFVPVPQSAQVLPFASPVIAAMVAAAASATSAANSAAAVGAELAGTATTASANMVAAPGQIILADTSAGSWTLTLPASGGMVTVRDAAAAWGANPLTIAGNGALIAGASTFSADASGYELVFKRVGASWRYSLSYLYGG